MCLKKLFSCFSSNRHMSNPHRVMPDAGSFYLFIIDPAVKLGRTRTLIEFLSMYFGTCRFTSLNLGRICQILSVHIIRRSPTSLNGRKNGSTETRITAALRVIQAGQWCFSIHLTQDPYLFLYGSAGHDSTCRYFWHSAVVSERVTRDFASAMSSSMFKR